MRAGIMMLGKGYLGTTVWNFCKEFLCSSVIYSYISMVILERKNSLRKCGAPVRPLGIQ